MQPRLGLGLVFAAVAMFVGLFGGAGTARAQGEVYSIMHVDTIPAPTAGGVTAAQLLKQLAADTVKEPGCVRFEVLQQADRENHFTLVGVWKDQKAFDAHEAAAHTRQFRTSIQPMLGSPFDERLHRLLP